LWFHVPMKLLLFLMVLSIATSGSTTIAQSSHAFGIPGPQSPSPTSSIKAVPGSRAEGWLDQGRSEVLARHGIVSTSDPLAAQAGL
jgi:gamma-glutamyltranspeptidase/glutathione hydrolase